MLELYYFDGDDNQFDILQPSESDVRRVFSMLDGYQYREMIFESDLGVLHIIGPANHRVFVTFTDDGEHNGTTYAGTLIDNTIHEGEVRFLLSNREVQTVKLSETVSKATAWRVLLHLFEHGELPKGLKWKGDMSYFE